MMPQVFIELKTSYIQLDFHISLEVWIPLAVLGFHKSSYPTSSQSKGAAHLTLRYLQEELYIVL